MTILVPILGFLASKAPGPAGYAIGAAGALAAVATAQCYVGVQSTIDNYREAQDRSPLQAATLTMRSFLTTTTKGLTWWAVYGGQVSSDCPIIHKSC